MIHALRRSLWSGLHCGMSSAVFWRSGSLRRSLWSGLHCGYNSVNQHDTGQILRRSLWSGLHCGNPSPTGSCFRIASPLLMERPPLRHGEALVRDSVGVNFAAPYGAASIAARCRGRVAKRTTFSSPLLMERPPLRRRVPSTNPVKVRFAAPYGAASIAATSSAEGRIV